MNAIGVLLELEDGTVEVRLLVRSDAVEAATPVEDVAGAEAKGPDGGRALEATGSGSYRAELPSYVPGAPYTLGFTIDEEGAARAGVYAGDFTLRGHGPIDRVEAWPESSSGELAELAWAPGGMPVLVEVIDDGVVTWSNFAPLAEIPGWSALAPGGRMEVPLSSPDAILRVCAVEAVQRDDVAAEPQHVLEGEVLEGQLGWLSGMVVGRCVAVEAPGDAPLGSD